MQTTYMPPSAFSAQAAIPDMETYQALCAHAERDYEGYWGAQARANLDWQVPFTRVLDEREAPFLSLIHI